MSEKITGSPVNAEARVGDNARRTFLGHTTALLASGAASTLLAAHALAAPATPKPGVKLLKPGKKTWDQPPPFKISLAQWSLHRALKGGEIDNLDFAKIASGFGIDAIEYVNQFFKDRAKDRKYLAEMKERARGEGVWSALIMIDGEGKLGDPDTGKRKLTIENHQKWVEAAAFLGCHSIRVNAGSEGSPEEQAKLVTDGLRRLSEFAGGHGINVIVENHGGLSSNGAWLAGVMKAVAHPRCGTLPDFGNFRIKDGEEYDRYQGVSELMPFAKAVSAKSHDFDRKGNEIHTDYLRMMKIVLDAGYHGYVGIEYEGSNLPELDGIAATKKLLDRVAEKLARKHA